MCLEDVKVPATAGCRNNGPGTAQPFFLVKFGLWVSGLVEIGFSLGRFLGSLLFELNIIKYQDVTLR